MYLIYIYINQYLYELLLLLLLLLLCCNVAAMFNFLR